jgi:hypothetical protein
MMMYQSLSMAARPLSTTIVKTFNEDCALLALTAQLDSVVALRYPLNRDECPSGLRRSGSGVTRMRAPGFFLAGGDAKLNNKHDECSLWDS